MLTFRPASQRGYAEHGWLTSWHSFSFADYFDPAHLGWGNLRVINEDFIAPRAGFPMHGHRDMEIVTYLIAGRLAHRDSMGHAESIAPGKVQRMSAGRGVTHSEFSTSDDTTHLLQIWILPNVRGIAPEYEQRAFADADKRGRLCAIATPDGAAGSLRIHADARLYAGLFDGPESTTLALDPARKAYVHLVHGALRVNGRALRSGDAALLHGEGRLELDAGQDAQVLVFDLAP